MSGILTLNSGSSSLKFALYADANEPELLVRGQVDQVGLDSELIMEVGVDRVVHPVTVRSQAEALHQVMVALEPHLGDLEVTGVGHRIVHGGSEYSAPVVLTPEVKEDLSALNPLAPLHQPHNLGGVAAAEALFPNTVQVGCFDTAFHRGHAWADDTFALPRRFYNEGVRRYGFHGLSYEYVTDVISRDHPELHSGRVIIAHLGNGSSMCATRLGKSVGSTMGFSALDGLPMGTRCGQLDPGVILYLIEQKGTSPKDIMTLLYTESGLLGLSGVSSDMRSLLASDAPEASDAIAYYVARAQREIGALSAVLGGIDALVFCGGIGENAEIIRRKIVEGLGYLGLQIARGAQSGARDVGAGPARILVIPTDEERVIARAVHVALAGRLNVGSA